MKIRLFTFPNLLTLANLVCGVLAILFALRYDNLPAAFLAIVVAAVFDFCDGFAARLLKQYSELGVQLDSLSDIVSFGVAPASVLFVLYNQAEPWAGTNPALSDGLGHLVWIAAAFSSLRLAKFNIDQTQHTEFVGLPTPANALLIASLGALVATGTLSLARIPILVLALLLSWLLISPIRMFSLKFNGFGWRGNELRYSFLLGSVLLLILFRTAGVPWIIALYIVVSTIRFTLQSLRRKQESKN